MTQPGAGPGTVLAVHGAGLAGKIIRLGEVLSGKPWPAGHVAIITHEDKLGRWIGIQGQPGGVGMVDCTPLLNDPLTRTNFAQPKPDDKGQMTAFLAGCAQAMGIQYDWCGIAEDTALALKLPDLAAEIDRLWRWPAKKDLLPGHVVCSSVAAMLYDLPQVGWAHPDLGEERVCMPADWWAWNDGKLWELVPPPKGTATP